MAEPSSGLQHAPCHPCSSSRIRTAPASMSNPGLLPLTLAPVVTTAFVQLPGPACLARQFQSFATELPQRSQGNH